MDEKKPLQTATPEELGIPSGEILRFLEKIERADLCMHSFLVIRHGKIAAEGYWKPFYKDRKHRMYSITKSITSVAVGIMAGEGLIDLDAPVSQYFPEKIPEEGIHPYIAKATVRDLLRMATPHETSTYRVLKDDEDWVRTFFTCPPSHLPGQVFCYDTSGTTVLCALVEKLSGKTMAEYLYPRLFEHIGFSEDAYCIKIPSGQSWGGSGMLCTARDLAKFALVCMDGGVHEGKQLIPADYIKAATSRQIDTSTSGNLRHEQQQGYGYQFWRCTHDGFVCWGMGGQLAVCLPDKDLVLVTLADTQPNPDGEGIIMRAFWDTVYESLSDSPLPEDIASNKKLTDKTECLSILLPKGSAASPLMEKASGRVFRLTKNDMGIATVRFDFSGDKGVFVYENRSGRHEIAFGLGETTCPQKFPDNNYDCVSSGVWVDEKTLLITTYIIDDYFGTLKTTVTFDNDSITIIMRRWAELFIEEYSGLASGYARS